MTDAILVYLNALEASGDNEEEARLATRLFKTSVNAHVQAGFDRMLAKQITGGWYSEKNGKKWNYISPDSHFSFGSEEAVRKYIEFCNTGSPSVAECAAFAHGFEPGWKLFRYESPGSYGAGVVWKCKSPEGQDFSSIKAAKNFVKAPSKQKEATATPAVAGSLLTIPFRMNTTLCIVSSGIDKNPITSVADDGGVVSSIDLHNFTGTLRFVTTSNNPSGLNGFVGTVSVDKIPVATETLTLTEDVKPSTTAVTDNKKPISLLDSSIASKNDVDESFAASAQSLQTSTTSMLGPFTKVNHRLIPCKRKLQPKFDANVGSKLSSKRSSTKLAGTTTTDTVDIIDLVSPAPLATAVSVKTKSVVTKLDAPSRRCVLKVSKKPLVYKSRYESSDDSSDDDSVTNN